MMIVLQCQVHIHVAGCCFIFSGVDICDDIWSDVE